MPSDTIFLLLRISGNLLMILINLSGFFMVFDTFSLSISISSDVVQVSSLYCEMNLMIDFKIKYFSRVSSVYLAVAGSDIASSYYLVTLTEADRYDVSI